MHFQLRCQAAAFSQDVQSLTFCDVKHNFSLEVESLSYSPLIRLRETLTCKLNVCAGKLSQLVSCENGDPQNVDPGPPFSYEIRDKGPQFPN